MPTLAPKLPWQHAFAGGYPRRGGQPLPTDPDAIDYLNRVAAADGGASVEVGIAQAIDAFVRGCKADSAGYAGDPTRSNWDAMQASCIMCGARTLSGALVPLKGTAPTPYNFASGDYSRSGATPGLKGNGIGKYLDTNYSDGSVGRDDIHMATYISSFPTVSNTRYMGTSVTASGTQLQHFSSKHFVYNRSLGAYTDTGTRSLGFLATSRQTNASYDIRQGGSTSIAALASAAVGGQNVFVFAYNGSGPLNYSDARLAFYSVGSALDLAAMDTRVTNMVTAIRFHTLTGLLPNDYDPATIAYITAAYAAGGTL